jgi:elongation factor Ts
MATVDAAAVKTLREMTNAGIMDCKAALVEAEGDMNRAATILREKGIAASGKKAGRATGEGMIGVHISADGKTAGIIEVNCETDFVARNDNFRSLVTGLAQQVESGAHDVAELLAQPYLKESGKTVEEHVRESIATIGENIVVTRLMRVQAESGVLGSYVHSDDKQAAIVEVTGGENEKSQALARDLAMQVVALKPEFVSREEVPSERMEAERAIYQQQAAQEGKPEAIQAKIAEGRLSKEFFQQVALLDQMFVKEQKQSVAQLVKQANADVVRFVRYRVGEGQTIEETAVEA